MKKVMVFGTFDGLHPGHDDFFRQAKEHGDYLIVVVGRDKTVRKTKGRLPLLPEVERRRVVAGNQYVDLALLGKWRDKYEIISEHQPQVICLGYDQSHFVDNIDMEIKKIGFECEIIRLKAFKPDIYKSSLLNKNGK